VVPSGYVGAYLEVGRRRVIAAAKRPAATAVACVGERPVAQARVRGHSGGLFQCPPDAGPHRNGLLLRWQERGTTMAVSVTGHLAAHRRLVLALAAPGAGAAQQVAATPSPLSVALTEGTLVHQGLQQ
jgi:hypothetical protein